MSKPAEPDADADGAADTNDDGALDMSDGVSLLNFLFLGEKAPGERAQTAVACVNCFTRLPTTFLASPKIMSVLSM